MKQMFNESRLDLSNFLEGTKAYVKPSIELNKLFYHIWMWKYHDTIRKLHLKALSVLMI